ncbi:MAG: stage III sporulation protein AE [Eubacterium sp.]
MKKRYILWMLFLTFVFCPITGQAEEKTADPLERLQQVYEENGGNATGFSLREEVEKILSGETEFSPSDLLHSFLDQVSKQWNEQKSDFIKLLILGILTGFCANLSQTLGDEGLGAVSFYVIYGVLCSIVLAGFRQVYDLAQEGVEGVFSFAGALVPSFALALGISGAVRRRWGMETC